MDDIMEKLKAEVNDAGLIKMLSSIEEFHKVRLYDYIKEGKDYDDYADDYANGSLLIGRVVTNGIDVGVVTRSPYWEDFRLHAICLDMFEEIGDAPYDESLLKEWTVINKNLDEYYSEKLNKEMHVITKQIDNTNQMVDKIKKDNQEQLNKLKQCAQSLHEYILSELS